MTAYEMRISSWSSDVCSSDLRRGRRGGALPAVRQEGRHRDRDQARAGRRLLVERVEREAVQHLLLGRPADPGSDVDRQSVVYGKSVSVSVELGGRRSFNKTNVK